MLISCLMFSLSFAEYALKNFPAQTFPVFFSTSRKTCPNFPLQNTENLFQFGVILWGHLMIVNVTAENSFLDC